MTAAVPQQTPRRHQKALLAAVVVCCIAFFSSAALAAISWKRVGTVTTLTNNQMCYSDGTNVVCDSSAPTLSGGNVGIGTTSPATAIDVVGSATVDGFANATARFYASTATGGVTIGSITGNTAFIGSGSGSVNGLRFFTNGSQASPPVLLLDNSGNVGIGTTSPTSHLHVQETTTDKSGNYSSSYFNYVTNASVGNITSIDIAAESKLDHGGGKLLTTGIGTKSTVSEDWGSMTNAYSYYGQILSTLNFQNITSGAVYYADSPSIVTNARLSNAYGIYVNTQKAVNVTTGYGMYQVGASDINYFAGNVGIGTTTPNALLDIGSAAATLGTMRLEGSTSGYVQIQPAVAAGSWTMTLPGSAGTNTYLLQTNGSGVTSWVAATSSFTGLTTGDLCTAASGTAIACASTLSGDVTSAGGTATVTTVAKIQGTTVSGTTGSTNVVFSASPTLTGTTAGVNLTLSGKESLTLGSDYTTTGSQSDVNLGAVSAVRYNGAGAATFQGLVAGTGGQVLYLHNPSAYTLTLADQSDSTDATAANKIITGIAGDLPIPTNTSVTLQYDSASSRWRVTGSSNAAKALAAGSDTQVQYNNSGNMAGEANFTWDYTNHRLGIGTSAAPLSKLDIYGGVAVGTSYAGVTAAPTNGMIVQGNVGIGTTVSTAALHIDDDSSNNGQFAFTYMDNEQAADLASTPSLFGGSLSFNMSGGQGDVDFINRYANTSAGVQGFQFIQQTGTGTFSNLVTISGDTGNVGIGTTSPSQTLSVIGAGYASAWGVGVVAANTVSQLRVDGTGAVAAATFVNGNVGIGTAVPAAPLELDGNSTSNTGGTLFVNDNSTSSAAPVIRVRGNRSDANTSQSFSGGLFLEHNYTAAAITSGMTLGTIYFGGNYDTTPDMTYSASISSVADGAWSGTSTAPAALTFYTGSTGHAIGTGNTTFGTERMRISSGGNVGIGTTSPATGMKVDINGPVKVAGTGSETCSASTVGAIRYNATGNYLEICSYP